MKDFIKRIFNPVANPPTNSGHLLYNPRDLNNGNNGSQNVTQNGIHPNGVPQSSPATQFHRPQNQIFSPTALPKGLTHHKLQVGDNRHYIPKHLGQDSIEFLEHAYEILLQLRQSSFDPLTGYKASVIIEVRQKNGKVKFYGDVNVQTPGCPDTERHCAEARAISQAKRDDPQAQIMRVWVLGGRDIKAQSKKATPLHVCPCGTCLQQIYNNRSEEGVTIYRLPTPQEGSLDAVRNIYTGQLKTLKHDLKDIFPFVGVNSLAHQHNTFNSSRVNLNAISESITKSLYQNLLKSLREANASSLDNHIDNIQAVALRQANGDWIYHTSIKSSQRPSAPNSIFSALSATTSGVTDIYILGYYPKLKDQEILFPDGDTRMRIGKFSADSSTCYNDGTVFDPKVGVKIHLIPLTDQQPNSENIHTLGLTDLLPLSFVHPKGTKP